jgi:hypothetical protein
MRKRISWVPTSILALTSLRKGCPRLSCTPKSPSMSRTTKLARMKEFFTHTSRFSTTPSGYQMVESASCIYIRVRERVGYCSCSNITLGIMFMLAPKVTEGLIEVAIVDGTTDH